MWFSGDEDLSFHIRLDLQFFADEGGEKTEEPTSKKLNDARKEGDKPHYGFPALTHYRLLYRNTVYGALLLDL